MRICIDIDGTICHMKEADQTYTDLKPIKGAAERIRGLRENGHYVIFCTARHMKTCNSNVGQVIARQANTLIEWLEKNEFVYDELWFGKPYAHIYIDDRAFKFNGSWKEIDENLISEYN